MKIARDYTADGLYQQFLRTGTMEALVYKDKKMLRRGYTTGTCAALAAQGAVSFLVSGIWPETAELSDPGGPDGAGPADGEKSRERRRLPVQ